MLQFNFTDLTILGCDGYFQCVNSLLLRELINGSRNWMVSSNLTMINDFGICDFKLNFYDSKKVQIVSYNPSSKEYNEDVQNLSAWSQERDWDIPDVHNDLVVINEKLWKRYWITGMVKSDKLSKKFKNLMEN